MSTSTSTKAAKSSLRRSISSTLSSLPQTTIASQSLTAQNLILSHPKFLAAKKVSIYLSMPASETQTSLLVTKALEEGKKVFVPYLHSPPLPAPSPGNDGSDGKRKGKKVMEMLQFRSLKEYEALGRDGWGIPTLAAEGVEARENAMGGFGPEGQGNSDAEEGGLDLVVVPGVAFDGQMRRLGHGAGFYDRWFTRYCEGGRGKPILVGLCLAEQVVASDVQIPTSEWDWNMDAVAVGDGRMLTLEG